MILFPESITVANYFTQSPRVNYMDREYSLSQVYKRLLQKPQSPRTKSWPKSGRRLVHTANRKALGPNLTETS